MPPPSPCSAWLCSRSPPNWDHDPLLNNRARLCAQLAVAAALGFLLLHPLQTLAALQINRGREVIGFGLERSRMGE